MTRSNLAINILKYKNSDQLHRFVLLRDKAGVLNGTYRDLDIFARKFNENTFESYVKSLGFIVVKKVSRYKFYQYCLLHTSEEIFILVDVWTKLHYKGVSYFKNYEMKPRLDSLGFSSLDQDQSLTVSFVKCLTQNKNIKPKYIESANECGYNFERHKVNTLLGTNTEKIFQKITSKFNWALAHAASFFIKKQLVIYLIGPDGAGKTTISDQIISSEIRAEVKYYHGRVPVLPRLQWLKGEQPKKVKYLDMNKRKFTTFHAIYYILDSLLARLVLNFSFWKDRLIICDRTHYDIVARESYRNVPGFIQNMLVASIYNPDACFLLYCNPKEIHKRKPELPIHEIEAQYIAYRSHKNRLKYHEVGTGSGMHSLSQIGEFVNALLYRN